MNYELTVLMTTIDAFISLFWPTNLMLSTWMWHSLLRWIPVNGMHPAPATQPCASLPLFFPALSWPRPVTLLSVQGSAQFPITLLTFVMSSIYWPSSGTVRKVALPVEGWWEKKHFIGYLRKTAKRWQCPGVFCFAKMTAPLKALLRSTCHTLRCADS